MRALGYAGAGCATVLIFVGMEADWRPYALLLIWMLCGLGFLKLRTRAHRRTDTSG